MKTETLSPEASAILNWYKYSSQLLYIGPREVQQKKLPALVNSEKGNINTTDHIKMFLIELVIAKRARFIDVKRYMIEAI